MLYNIKKKFDAFAWCVKYEQNSIYIPNIICSEICFSQYVLVFTCDELSSVLAKFETYTNSIVANIYAVICALTSLFPPSIHA